MRAVIKGENKFELGKSKIFFRAGQLAYLEKVRTEKFTSIIILIQKNTIRFYHQNKFRKMKVAVVKMQACWRAFAARRLYKEMRQVAASIVLQKNWRFYIARQKYKKTLLSISVIQRAWRSYVGKRDFEYFQRKISACKIQATWKMFLQRKLFRKDIHRVVITQSCWKRRKARKEFKSRKAEARSVGGLKEKAYKLDKKVIELSIALDSKKKEASDLLKLNSSLEDQLASTKEKYFKLEAESKLKGSGAQEETAELKKNLGATIESRDSLIKDAEKLNGMIRKRDDQLSTLQKELDTSALDFKKLKDDMRNSSKTGDAQNVTDLKKENADLKDQMRTLLAGKYKTDVATEGFLAASPTIRKSIARSKTVSTVSDVARASKSFLASAIDISSRVLGTSTLSLDTTPGALKVNQIEIEDDAEPKEVSLTTNKIATYSYA